MTNEHSLLVKSSVDKLYELTDNEEIANHTYLLNKQINWLIYYNPFTIIMVK